MIKFQDSFIQQGLAARRASNQLRELQEVTPLAGAMVMAKGRKMINFCSNDYLGLAQHPLLTQRSIEYMKRFGNGATASRLVCGNFSCFVEIEEKLARLKGREAGLILNSGFQANVSYLAALADRHSLIIVDRLSHNSLVQGSLLARCQLLRFRHNDMQHLSEILADVSKKEFSRIFIVTESVFSMDGDCCDLETVESLARKYGAFLIVDEAHATGVFGENGMGRCCHRDVDLVMGTFGKACGSFGAYLASSEAVRQFLLNYCSGLIYSTALPPSVMGAIDAALDLVPGMDKERRELLALADFLRNSLAELGFDTGASSSQIIPLIVGSEEETILTSQWLADHGILASAIRPPTVENGRSRIRLALSVLHRKEHIEELLFVLGKWREKN